MTVMEGKSPLASVLDLALGVVVTGAIFYTMHNLLLAKTGYLTALPPLSSPSFVEEDDAHQDGRHRRQLRPSGQSQSSQSSRRQTQAQVQVQRMDAEDRSVEGDNLFFERYKLARRSVEHRGACHCGKIVFAIRAPAVLHAIDSPSKIRFPRVVVPCDHFELLSDAEDLSMYPVQISPKTIGIYTFCSSCSVQIVFSPSLDPVEVHVNADCLEPSSIEHIEYHYQVSAETQPCPSTSEEAQSVNRRGAGHRGLSTLLTLFRVTPEELATRFAGAAPSSSGRTEETFEQDDHSFPNSAPADSGATKVSFWSSLSFGFFSNSTFPKDGVPGARATSPNTYPSHSTSTSTAVPTTFTDLDAAGELGPFSPSTGPLRLIEPASPTSSSASAANATNAGFVHPTPEPIEYLAYSPRSHLSSSNLEAHFETPNKTKTAAVAAVAAAAAAAAANSVSPEFFPATPDFTGKGPSLVSTSTIPVDTPLHRQLREHLLHYLSPNEASH